MIAPVSGIQHLVSLLDDIAEKRPRLPSLVVAVTSADGCETARGFLEGYQQRLSADGALVPHASGSDQALPTEERDVMPDVKLLDQLVNQLKETIRPGIGGPWRPSFFETCYDVITANDVRRGQIVDQQQQLHDHLYKKKVQRTRWLKWIQEMAASESVQGKTLGLIAMAVFSGPSRWWLGRRLKSNKWHWFGEHVRSVTGRPGDFLSHALKVIPGGERHENEELRNLILVDALIHDLDQLIRHRKRKFFPRHRRRRWTPALLLDCTGKQGPVYLDVVHSFITLTKNKPVSPLLVIAAMEPTALESDAGTPHSVKETVDLLEKYVNRTPSTLTGKQWLPVLLTSEPEDRTAGGWLNTHRKVNTWIPGPFSAWAPVALTAVIALAATTIVAYRYLFGSCTDTWTNDLGERVGLSDGSCEFTPGGENSSDLRDLEKQIRENNEAVDGMKDVTGTIPRDYRIVVFFAPLTRPDNVAERTAPPNALWQLRGAVGAQKRLNEAAAHNADKFPIKLLLANSGDLFDNGPDVASVIAEQPLKGPGSVAAVIGISQSRDKAREAFKNMPDIPVIGASLTGNEMTEGNNNFFMVAPPNDAIAKKMAGWVHDHKTERKYTSAAIVYDPDDLYFSVDLRDSLRTYLPDEIQLLPDDIELGEKISTSDTKSLAKQLCNQAVAGVLPVLTGRADQLRKLFTDADAEPACREQKITMLAGYGAVVAVASGQLDQYKWLNLAYTAVAGTAAKSDEATGNDALLAASEAINKDALSDKDPSAGGVLYQLGQGFTVNGDTGTFTMTMKDHKDLTTNRIRILETNPNS